MERKERGERSGEREGGVSEREREREREREGRGKARNRGGKGGRLRWERKVPT